MARARGRRSMTAAILLAAALALAQPLAAAAANCPSHNGDNTLDSVKEWKKTCAEAHNYECNPGACSLWSMVRSQSTTPNSYVYVGDGKNRTYRTKILPTTAVTGLESIVNGTPGADAATSFLWEKGITEALNGQAKIDKSNRMMAFVNALHTRSQHQLHIHLGAATGKSTFYECVYHDIIKTPPAVGQPWRSVKDVTTTACDNLKVTNSSRLSIQAKQVASGKEINDAIRDGFKGGQITSDPQLLRTGVLVQPILTPKGAIKSYLVYLIAGSDDYHVFGDKRMP